MKAAVILYHKNVDRYPRRWTKQCIDSILNQTYRKYDIFEMDYGGNDHSLMKRKKKGTIFINKVMNNHAEAHNYLLDIAFDSGYDCVFNVNIDDYYAPERFDHQIRAINAGFHLISSNFYNVDENDNIIKVCEFHRRNFLREAHKNHNIIAHPVICYSRHFWTNCPKLDPLEIPRDDFQLWLRTFSHFKFLILKEFLLYYRVHEKKVSHHGSKAGSLNHP